MADDLSAQRTVFHVNRAPVLTLWATVVAERLGYRHEEALTLGRAVAGLNAQSKGRRLGIYAPKAKEEAPARRHHEDEEEFFVEVCGRTVPAKQTEEGIRATANHVPIRPSSVEHYLAGAFGDSLAVVTKAMRMLAKSLRPQMLTKEAFHLYEQFRPNIPAGVRGWGAKGSLDLRRITTLGHTT